QSCLSPAFLGGMIAMRRFPSAASPVPATTPSILPRSTPPLPPHPSSNPPHSPSQSAPHSPSPPSPARSPPLPAPQTDATPPPAAPGKPGCRPQDSGHSDDSLAVKPQTSRSEKRFVMTHHTATKCSGNCKPQIHQRLEPNAHIIGPRAHRGSRCYREHHYSRAAV